MATVQDSEPEGHHILLHCFGGWGHIRPLCNFAARVAKENGTNVTFLISPTYYKQTQQELSRQFENGADESKLIRLIGLKEDVTVSSIEQGDRLFEDVYQSMVETGSLRCSVSNTLFEGLTHPDSAVIDFYGIGPLQAIRRNSRKTVKVLVWNVGAVSYLLRVFGPISEEGIEHWQTVVGTRAAETGKNFVEAADDILTGGHGTVTEIPGMPKLYDWELFPQPLPSYPMGLVSVAMYQLLCACDGIIHITAEAYEPVYTAAFEKWFGREKKSYVLGPILPDFKGDIAKTGELVQSTKAKNIQDFLDAALKSHGANSLLYIMSHGSPQAVVPPDVIAKAESSGLGIFAKWSPQQVILDHQATGWFVSHCGQNSCLESLSSGIPLIAWPYAIDQATNALHVSCVLNVGYELLEVRSGEMGLKTVYRTGKAPDGTVDAVRREAKNTLELARGPDGVIKRQNAQKIKQQLAEAWAEHGPAYQAFRRLLSDINIA
ncbi:hypothetical protein PUNSTDRAFT_137124 [Punctularia strigosozonata HHB-11173 SS5]|uniref:uncharacterized protein n=1 Tax=Punctularia strigosozonata (strain HHB-11173) TaxID=741275 RepID=UPI0004418248|nr:uncharacterized protein PUNSTDRAFT_137124 [Punctularia strigosozonata HHB-11173 SS5]EIN06349.1 hypothetical protein PUNSTDRAFT_137124 [Punctularia strigosozonata HHB-11173 SS5]